MVRGLVINRFGGNGIDIQASNCVVASNYIGTDRTGAADLGNGHDGVLISGGARYTVVDGTTAGERNVISGNAYGVDIIGGATSGNQVLGNRIGLAAGSGAAIGNSIDGVRIESALNNLIGGTAAGTGNVIAHNGFSGVHILTGTGNSVLGNRIFDNDEGITLAAFGNNGINSPVVATAALAGSNLHLVGSFTGVPGQTLRIEFFSSPTNDGEGKKYLGFIVVGTGGDATVGIDTMLPVTGVTIGQFITATATDQLGNTSGFSVALAVS